MNFLTSIEGIMALIFGVAAFIAVIVAIIFYAKYVECKSTCETYKNLSFNAEKKNKELIKEKDSLEASLKGVKKTFDLELQNKEEELQSYIKKYNDFVDSTKKKSEAAKKAAETRKKNKESQKTTEKLVDKE